MEQYSSLLWLGLISFFFISLSSGLGGSIQQRFPSHKELHFQDEKVADLERLSGKRILIVQNNGGGHGSLGYYLAKTVIELNRNLREHALSPIRLTLWQDLCDYRKSPFRENLLLQQTNPEYYTLDNEILTTKVVSPTEEFDCIVDNWSKTEENIYYIFDNLLNRKVVKDQQYILISSAGMYESCLTYPIFEEDPVKESNPIRKIELAILAKINTIALKYTFVRPQYLYGPSSAKDYFAYFTKSIEVNKPVSLPYPGNQLVCLTHQQDAANMILSTVNNPVAFNQVFNCGTNRFITYQGLVELMIKAGRPGGSQIATSFILSKEVEKDFPFRKETFITSSSKAIKLLPWRPKFLLENELVHLLPKELSAELKL